MLRFIEQTKESSKLELNSMRNYLAFELVFPCLRGNSSNSTTSSRLLSGRVSSTLLRVETLGDYSTCSSSDCQSPETLLYTFQPASNAVFGCVGANVVPTSASVPGKGLRLLPCTWTTGCGACRGPITGGDGIFAWCKIAGHVDLSRTLLSQS